MARDKIYTGVCREPDGGKRRVVGAVDGRRRVVGCPTTANIGLSGPPTADVGLSGPPTADVGAADGRCRGSRRQMSGCRGCRVDSRHQIVRLFVLLTADVGVSGLWMADISLT